MKTSLLIAVILVVSLAACQKVVDVDPNLRSLLGAPSGPGAKSDSVATKPADSTKSNPADSTKQKSDTATTPAPPFPQQTYNNNGGATTPASGCSVLPIYGDTIVFPQPSGSDYIISPVNSPGAGKYFSWPVGMVLNQTTGAINLTQSQTGMKYIMGFVKAGTTDTCLSTLVIGGAAYYDSVYVFANGATTAPPYFEANPYLPSVCATPGSCTFDYTGSAAAQKVVVDKNTGVIDLQKTLNGTGLLGGAFGLLPVNGQTLLTTITYKINYGSNNALQQIQVQLEYYNSKQLINIGLLNGIINSLDNVLSGNVISTSANPRPPLVIMTRYN